MTMRKPIHHQLLQSAESYKFLYKKLKEFVICFDSFQALVGDQVTIKEANRTILGGSITGSIRSITRHAYGLQCGYIILSLENIDVLENKGG